MLTTLKGFRLAALLFVTACAFGQPLAAQQPATEPSRDSWQRLDDIFKAMGAVPGAHVADIGAGSGYFTSRLADSVTASGRVYAVDVNPIALRRLRDNVAASRPHVEVIAGTENDPRLPAARLDGALIVNAYHEFAEHQAMLAHIRASLKPGGKLVLIEPIPRAAETVRAEQEQRHSIAIEFVEADLRAAGFEIVAKDLGFVTRPHHGDDAATGPTDWLLVAQPIK